jgi:YD repeat-containing protein
MGRLVQRTDPLGNSVTYAYDGNGNLLSFVDPRGNAMTWQYDVRNRPLQRMDALAQAETYQYDAAGNLSRVADRKGQVSGFTYDGLKRQTGVGFGGTTDQSHGLHQHPRIHLGQRESCPANRRFHWRYIDPHI